jgi:hypothetical protein
MRHLSQRRHRELVAPAPDHLPGRHARDLVIGGEFVPQTVEPLSSDYRIPAFSLQLALEIAR